MQRNVGRVAAIAVVAGLSGAAWGQCRSPRWTPDFSTPELGLQSGMYSGEGYAFQVFDADGAGPARPRLYVGGWFEVAGGISSTAIAAWDGRAWHALAAGLGPPQAGVTGLGLHDPDGPGPLPPVLVVAGSFTSAGGMPVDHVAQWDGQHWSPMGSLAASFSQRPLIDFDPDGPGPMPPELYVGAGSVRRWDGTQWVAVPGAPGLALALAVYDEDGDGPLLPALFAGIDASPGLYRWDGASWSVVGGGLSRSAEHRCSALCVVDEDGPGPARPTLWVGGTILLAGDVPVQNVARWDGQQWSPVGLGAGGLSGQVESLVTVDYTHGAGAPTVFAATTFDEKIFRWDPPAAAWSPIGQADSGPGIFLLHQLAAYDDGNGNPALYFTAPALTVVDGVPSYGLARYACACYSNCDGSTAPPVSNVNDFICFMREFAAGNSYANCDGSTIPPVLNVNDFVCFQSRFVVGCR